MRSFHFSLAALALVATPALALDPPVIVSVSPAADGRVRTVLLFTNGDTAQASTTPATIPATLHGAAGDVPVTLRAAASVRVPAGGFVRAAYAFAMPGAAAGQQVLSLGNSGGYAFAIEPSPALARAEPAPVAPAPATPSLAVTANPAVARDNPMLANLSAYQPIYAASGLGTSTNGKLQISFQYQVFGDARAPAGSWLEGFRLAYTQRMLWELGRHSSPFRDVNYEPEAYYRYRIGPRFDARAGILHESNGRGGDVSRGYQEVYAQADIEAQLGRYTITAGPRVVHYILGRSDNPDIARYRGHQSLALSIGTPDGFKLSADTRFNFGSGKGAVDALLSYPVTHLWHELPLYLVVQGFTGYGEDLLDYDRQDTRLRVGLGIVR